jgi:DNA mismatch repair protein MLH3
MSMAIRPLPADVIAQIKSSIAITNLNTVICELFKNSLDAKATKVDIIVDYRRGGCIVEDNGLGILPLEFGDGGGLGKLHRELANPVFPTSDGLRGVDTSKLNTQSPTHGIRGSFLACLSAMSVLLITSHHQAHRSHNTVTMYKSQVVSRQTPAPPQQHLTFDHGTRVSVRDLFGNIPVRVKHRAMVAEKQRAHSKDWEELKNEIVALLLSWPRNVAITIRETESSQKLSIRPPTHFDTFTIEGEVHLPWLCAILSQASFISPEDKDDWVAVGASTPNLKICGAISLDPSATKHVQFFSFGIQPLIYQKSILHDEINRLFSNSSFGNVEGIVELDDSEKQRRARDRRFKIGSYTSKELKGAKKGVDRWPMFYINIQDTRGTTYLNHHDLDEVMDEKGGGLRDILELIRAIVLEFLARNHFRPRAGRSRQAKASKSPTKTDNSAISPHQIFTDSDPKLPSASPAKKRPRKNARIKFDHFGRNVKLPSFRVGVSAESAFESWSRVKSGLAATKSTDSKQDMKPLSDGFHIRRPATAPLPLTTIPFNIRSSSPNLPTQSAFPLVSKTGRIVRRPFDDVDVMSSRLRNPAPQMSQPLRPGSHDQAPAIVLPESDEVLTWTNPATKVLSLVNRRTGLTVPVQKPKGTDASFALSLSSRQGTKRKISREPSSSWINGILQEWDNPVFAPTEPSIPQIVFDGLDATSQELLHGRHHHCSQIEIDRAFKEASSGLQGKISKEALRDAEVMTQVDNKFILVKLRASKIEGIENDGDGETLVLIDQHAADERIRIESLMEELCTPLSLPMPSATTQSKILTSMIDKPLILEVNPRDTHLLEKNKQHFANWGILYALPSQNLPPSFNSKGKPIQQLTVTHLPLGIIERCKLDPRLLIDLIRTEVYKINDQPAKASPSPVSSQASWLERIHTCPQGLIDMLNSRACRSAIMFNDELSHDQCTVLLRKLSRCLFPFQCAHGRPSLVPLVDLKVGLRGMGKLLEEENGGDFAKSFRIMKEKISPR